MAALVSTQRRTVLGSQPVKAASRSWDRLRVARAVLSSGGVRTGKVARGVGTVSRMDQPPNAKARAMQKPTNAAAAMRSMTARTMVNMGSDPFRVRFRDRG